MFMRSKKSFPLSLKILLGMVIGMAFGLVAVWLQFEGFVSDWISPFGTIFLRLLKLVAIPLVLVSLIKGIGGLKDISNLSSMGLKTLGTYIVTTIIAVVIGLVAVSLIKPGNFFPQDKSAEYMQKYEYAVEQRASVLESEKSPLQFLVDIVPDNAIQAAGDNSKMLQIIFIAIIFGVAMVAIGSEKTRTVMKIVSEINDIILKIIDFIMEFAPFGVFALMAGLIVDFSGDVGMFKALGMYALTVIIALFFIIIVFYPTLIRLFTKKGLKRFFKSVFPVQILAFTTSSSAATLPVTMERVQDELGVSDETASFVLPVGVTVNMDGTSCYQAVAVVFLAQVLGMDLSISQMLIIVLTATISSIGTPGIPGGSIVMLMMVLSSVGIPVEGLALIMGIDRPLDMLRTVVNVTGDTTIACIIDEKSSKTNTKEVL